MEISLIKNKTFESSQDSGVQEDIGSYNPGNDVLKLCNNLVYARFAVSEMALGNLDNRYASGLRYN